MLTNYVFAGWEDPLCLHSIFMFMFIFRISYSRLFRFPVLTDFIQSVAIFTAAVVAAKSFHQSIMTSILHAPMCFFDTTPVGRILNRFSNDIDKIDNAIPDSMRFVLKPLCGPLMTLIIICYSLPLFLVVLIPLAGLFFTLRVRTVHIFVWRWNTFCSNSCRYTDSYRFGGLDNPFWQFWCHSHSFDRVNTVYNVFSLLARATIK